MSLSTAPQINTSLCYGYGGDWWWHSIVIYHSCLRFIRIYKHADKNICIYPKSKQITCHHRTSMEYFHQWRQNVLLHIHRFLNYIRILYQKKRIYGSLISTYHRVLIQCVVPIKYIPYHLWFEIYIN